MIILDATNEKLQLTTSSAEVIHVVVTYQDMRNGSLRPAAMASQETTISSATTTDVLAAPATGYQRQALQIRVNNAGAAANTVTLLKDTNGTDLRLAGAIALATGEFLIVDLEGKTTTHEADGKTKVTGSSAASGLSAYNGWAAWFIKNGTAPEAAANWYCFAKDNGSPGIWAPGAPGVNGRTTDGTAAADAGCILYKNAATGANYLTNWSVKSSRVAPVFLMDIVWLNTGLAVAAGAQAIVSGAMPARDINGAVSGEGYGIGILVLTTLGNAAAIATTTCTYTNSAGTAGRTATLTAQTGYQMPATAVLGTFVPMQLAAGDKGVQSIQSFNTGTTYTSGTYSLVVYRMIDMDSVLVANTATQSQDNYNPGIKLYNGTCMFPLVLADGTTAYSVAGTLSVMER